ncbi:TPA: glycosyltransferase family 39 protein [Candidatus Poribacteria bacterium]|nr:glycosyltransferase family 39 protein [Candidatus Poribacteria bacterium]HIB90102.1 glycosyltransferase family 39 protein [Candidatus Poribacteria bacterium]HIC00270.1 glycosyltransferase family 39 protein [Candidatus Poribacteria bacterium]HIM12634.1 glycosyltransferase family 39 protein [Candidatus Poribacteria bacterium]HIN28552.1 glycosyltransferase family 39 protein [Candidatus Poribacteria bacterium]
MVIQRIYRSIPFQFFLVVSVLWTFHQLSPFLIEHYQISLQVNKTTAPIFGGPARDLNKWIVLPIMVFIIYFYLIRIMLKAELAIPTPVILAVAIGLKVSIDVSVTMINGQFLPPITNHGVAQYLTDVPKFESLGDILKNYTTKANQLTTHAGTHPPGPVLTLWLATKYFGYDKLTKAFLIIFTAPISLIPLYLIAKQIFDQRVAFYTLALYLVTPNIVLLTATCMDAFYAVFLISSIYFYLIALEKRSVILAILTGLFLAISMFLTFATTFLGVYFITLTGFTYINNKKAFRNHVTTLCVSGGTFCLVYLLMYLTTGYNAIACLMEAVYIDDHGSDHHGGVGTGYETLSRYLFISATNFFAFFSCLGAITVTLWTRELISTIRQISSLKSKESNMEKQEDQESTSESLNFLLAYVSALIPIGFSTLYTAETERIWIFMAPFILIPTAKHLKKHIDLQKNHRIFYITITLLFIQTVVFEIFLNTLW